MGKCRSRGQIVCCGRGREQAGGSTSVIGTEYPGWCCAGGGGCNEGWRARVDGCVCCDGGRPDGQWLSSTQQGGTPGLRAQPAVRTKRRGQDGDLGDDGGRRRRRSAGWPSGRRAGEDLGRGPAEGLPAGRLLFSLVAARVGGLAAAAEGLARRDAEGWLMVDAGVLAAGRLAGWACCRYWGCWC